MVMRREVNIKKLVYGVIWKLLRTAAIRSDLYDRYIQEVGALIEAINAFVESDIIIDRN